MTLAPEARAESAVDDGVGGGVDEVEPQEDVVDVHNRRVAPAVVEVVHQGTQEHYDQVGQETEDEDQGHGEGHDGRLVHRSAAHTPRSRLKSKLAQT